MNTHLHSPTTHTHTPTQSQPKFRGSNSPSATAKKNEEEKKCDLNKVDEQKCSFNLLVIVEKFSLSFSCDCCATKKNKQTKKYNNYKLREGKQKQNKTLRSVAMGNTTRRTGREVFGWRRLAPTRVYYIYICMYTLYIFVFKVLTESGAARAPSFFSCPRDMYRAVGFRVFLFCFMHK